MYCNVWGIEDEMKMRSRSVKMVGNRVGLKIGGTEWVLYYKSSSKRSIQSLILDYITILSHYSLPNTPLKGLWISITRHKKLIFDRLAYMVRDGTHTSFCSVVLLNCSSIAQSFPWVFDLSLKRFALVKYFWVADFLTIGIYISEGIPMILK